MDSPRDLSLLALRPQISVAEFADQSRVELFQNNTLRPILKFQNELLISRFLNDLLTLKAAYPKMDVKSQRSYVDQRLKTDKKLQKELIGICTGLMTIAEYDDYWEQKSELNKRIVTMLAERIYSQTATIS